VTINEVWIGNRIYWTLTLATANNYDSHWVTHFKGHCNYSTHTVFSVFISRYLVAVFIDGSSPSSGFPNCPRPHLPTSQFSQLQLSTDSTTTVSYITTDGQSVLVSSTHLGLTTRFLLLSDSCGFVDVGRPLWRENRSVFYYVQCTIYCWPFTFLTSHNIGSATKRSTKHADKNKALDVVKTEYFNLKGKKVKLSL
jgi:hypothetical protein